MKRIVVLSAVAFALSACASPILKTSAPPLPSSKAKVGVIYYLPKALIPITVTIDKNIPKENNNAGTDTNAGKISQSQTLTNNISITNTTGEVKPQDSKQAPAKASSIITIGKPKLVADTKESYFLEYHPEIATDDVVNIGIGANHLLQTTTATSMDQSGNAAVLLAKIGIEVAKAVTVPIFKSLEKEPKKPDISECQDLESIKIDTYLDPTAKASDEFSQKTLENLLAQTPIRLTVTPEAPRENSAFCTKGSENCINPFAICKEDETTNCFSDAGILFRSLKEYTLTVDINPNNNISSNKKPWCVTQETRKINFLAPNNGVVYSVDITRAAFVNKRTDLSIVDGMLTKIEIDKPSSLIGGLSIPLKIVEAIVNIPSQLLTLRIKKFQDEGALTKAEGELLLNKIQKLENERLLQKAETASVAQ